MIVLGSFVCTVYALKFRYFCLLFNERFCACFAVARLFDSDYYASGERRAVNEFTLCTAEDCQPDRFSLVCELVHSESM